MRDHTVRTHAAHSASCEALRASLFMATRDDTRDDSVLTAQSGDPYYSDSGTVGAGMPVTFPSEAFFQALAAAMAGAYDRFRNLGFFDATIGIRVLSDDDGGAERLFVLAFEVFECVLAEEVPIFTPFRVDFVLEGKTSTWREMIENIRRNGGADVAHSINTLTHFGEQLTLRYDDPDGHDKLYRFAESVQQFFDLAATLDDVTYEGGARRAAPAA